MIDINGDRQSNDNINAAQGTTPIPYPQPNDNATEIDEEQAHPPVSAAADTSLSNQTTCEQGVSPTDHEGSSDMLMDVDQHLDAYRGRHNRELEADVETRKEEEKSSDEREEKSGDGNGSATSMGDGESTTKSDEGVPDKGNSQIGTGCVYGDHMGGPTVKEHDATGAASQVGDTLSSPTSSSSPTVTSPSSLTITSPFSLTVTSPITTSGTTAELLNSNATGEASTASNRGTAAAGIINAVVRNVSLSNINIPGGADIDTGCPAWLVPTLGYLRQASTHARWQELVSNLIMFEKAGPATGVSHIFILFYLFLIYFV